MAPKRTSVRIPINADLWTSGLERYNQRTLIAWAATIIEAHLEADQRVSLPQPTTTSSIATATATATEQTHTGRDRSDRSDRPDVDRANNLLGHEQADLYRSTIDGIVDYLAAHPSHPDDAFAALIEALTDAGMEPQHRPGRSRGLAFLINGTRYSASDFGYDYSGPALINRIMGTYIPIPQPANPYPHDDNPATT